MKSAERAARLILFCLGLLAIASSALSPLLGQYIAHHGPAWMLDGEREIGFGTFLSIAFVAIGLAVLGMYLLKEATE